jgi:hypothetical protein
VHKLAGARLPRGTLDLAGGGTARLYSLFGEGRFALLEAAGQDGSTGGAHGAGTGAADLVRRVRYRRCQGARLPAAVLARPDGYIAWASDERDASLRTGRARAAVRAWCGSA